MKVYVTFYLLLCGLYVSHAQCDNQVSTKPTGPQNLALPDVSGSTNTPDIRFLNGLDWINGNLQDNSKGYRLDGMMYNPNQPYSNMANIQDPNISADYSYLNRGLDAELMTNEVGWELMLVNLGRFPDDQTPTSNFVLFNVPYLVFYNRYTSIVRVFVQYGYNEPPPGAINGVKINLYYNLKNNEKNLSGIFRLGGGIDRALNQKTKSSGLTFLSPRNGQHVFWMSADFQVAYDPCVCIYPTDIKLDFEFFTTTKVELYGRGITTDEKITNNTSILNKDFLSGVNFQDGIKDDGFVMYKHMNTLIDDYENKMIEYQNKLAETQEQNKEIERNLKIVKATKLVLEVGIAAASGSPQVLALQGDLSNFFFSDTSKASKERASKLIKKAESLIGKELNLYLNKKLTPVVEPTPPTQPTASFTEMYFEGQLKTELPVNGPLFSTPGSFKNHPNSIDLVSNAVYGYPIYNQPLGTFALLASPNIRISETVEDKFEEVNNELYGIYSTGHVQNLKILSVVYQNYTRSYQFKLFDDLKYVFNTALDIKGEPQIETAFVIKAKTERIDDEPLTDYSARQNAYIDPTYTANMESSNTDLDSYSVLFGRPEWQQFDEGNSVFLSTDQQLSYHSPNYTFYSSELKKESVNLSTPFFPINSFHPIVFGFGIKNERVKRTDTGFPWYLFHTLGVQSPPGLPSGLVALGNLPDSSTVAIDSEVPLDPDTYGFRLNDFDIELKVSIDIEFQTLRPDGTNNRIKQVLTYKINGPDVVDWSSSQPLYPDLVGSVGDITQYPEDLSFSSNTDFNGSPVDGCKYVNNHYTCKAWNSIIIDSELKSSNGKTVDLIAGEVITMNPGGILNPEIVASIETVLDYSQPMPPKDDIYVKSFCDKALGTNEPSYQANTAGRELIEAMIRDSIRRSEQNNLNTAESLLITLFPNPATNSATVQLSREAYGANVQVFDLMGRASNVAIRQDGLQFVMDLSNLVHGVYMVKISSIEGTETKSLIVK